MTRKQFEYDLGEYCGHKIVAEIIPFFNKESIGNLRYEAKIYIVSNERLELHTISIEVAYHVARWIFVAPYLTGENVYRIHRSLGTKVFRLFLDGHLLVNPFLEWVKEKLKEAAGEMLEDVIVWMGEVAKLLWIAER